MFIGSAESYIFQKNIQKYKKDVFSVGREVFSSGNSAHW